MANEIKAKYNCTQPELYAICTLGWNLCKNSQATMEINFVVYTVTYIDGKIADIQTAEELPGLQQRDMVTETARINMKQLAADGVEQWQYLERYITHAFQSQPELIKPNLEGAGKDYYEAATRENPDWESVKQLLVDGKKYLDDYGGGLAGFMPVGFPVAFANAKTAFDTQYASYTVLTAESPGGTLEKITANNLLYDDLMLMLGDIVLIVPDELKSEATFTHLKSIISSAGPAGLKGTLKDAVTNNMLAGAAMRLVDTDYETVSTAEGYDFGNIASGTYMLEIVLAGYETLLVPVTIATGVTSTKNYVLQPL